MEIIKHIAFEDGTFVLSEYLKYLQIGKVKKVRNYVLKIEKGSFAAFTGYMSISL